MRYECFCLKWQLTIWHFYSIRFGKFLTLTLVLQRDVLLWNNTRITSCFFIPGSEHCVQDFLLIINLIDYCIHKSSSVILLLAEQSWSRSDGRICIDGGSYFPHGFPYDLSLLVDCLGIILWSGAVWHSVSRSRFDLVSPIHRWSGSTNSRSMKTWLKYYISII